LRSWQACSSRRTSCPQWCIRGPRCRCRRPFRSSQCRSDGRRKLRAFRTSSSRCSLWCTWPIAR
jgi:hypothetical protein